MEELLAYTILFKEELLNEEEYEERLHTLFLQEPENEMLLELEWEKDKRQRLKAIWAGVDCCRLQLDRFGKALMKELEKHYASCGDIDVFSGTMYSLWESLPGNLQSQPPFCCLSYADDLLAYGDEEGTRSIYEEMLGYYRKREKTVDK